MGEFAPWILSVSPFLNRRFFAMPAAVMARLLLVGCLAAGLTPPSRVVEALASFPQLATCSGCASVVARRRVCAMLQTAAMRQDQPWKYLRPTSGTGTVLQQVCALPASSHLTRQQRHPNVLPEGVVACVVVARNASSTVAAATAARASRQQQRGRADSARAWLTMTIATMRGMLQAWAARLVAVLAACLVGVMSPQSTAFMSWPTVGGWSSQPSVEAAIPVADVESDGKGAEASAGTGVPAHHSRY